MGFNQRNSRAVRLQGPLHDLSTTVTPSSPDFKKHIRLQETKLRALDKMLVLGTFMSGVFICMLKKKYVILLYEKTEL